MRAYTVYLKTNADGYITAVASSAFLTDTTGWVDIARGYGDKYCHAQGNYFPQPLLTNGGAYRYRLVNGIPEECTEAEIEAQENALAPGTLSPSLENRVEILEADSTDMKEALEMILTGVTE